MVWPASGRAEMVWFVDCSDTRLASLSLGLIACSTLLNEISCWVNWLVSSGERGFWFLSCVVSNFKNVWKSLPSPVVEDLVGVVAGGLAAANVSAMLGVVMA